MDQGALDLHRAQPVAGDVEHVVDAAHDPEVAVLVAAGAVAGEVDVRHLAPVLLAVALVVAVDGPQHRRPGLLDDQQAALVGRHRLALPVHDLGHDARQRPRRRARLGRRSRPASGAIMIMPVSVCHQVSTIGQRFAADDLVIPHPGLGVDRLADRAQQTQARQVVLARPVVAPLDEGADGRRGRVEDVDAVLLDDLPEAVLARMVRRPLVHHGGGAVGQRAVDDVAVPGHPADVGRAPVGVVLAQVEDPAVGQRRARAGSRPWCAGRPWACRSSRWCRG